MHVSFVQVNIQHDTKSERLRMLGRSSVRLVSQLPVWPTRGIRKKDGF